jgi:hypothetical protein
MALDHNENFINELPEPPKELFGKIMNRIHREQRLIRIKQRIVIFSVGALASLAAVFPAFQMLKAELASSGFFTFSSLLFSDFSIVAAYWQNFTLSLLETLPIMGLAAVLTATVIFLGSIKFLTKDIRDVFVSA